MSALKCVSGKYRYPSQLLAEDALIELWSRNDYPAGRGPVSVYQCEDCGDFHFTSKGEMNPRLLEAIASKKISLQKEANKWLDKFKKR